MRIAIRVKPGSARPGVGGEHDGALVVRVSARAVDGKATEAALAAVAGSFGVRRSAVRLVSGASSRTKIVDIDADDQRILAALLAAPGRLRPWQDAAAVRPSVMSDVITRPAGTRPPRCRPRMMRFIPPNRNVHWFYRYWRSGPRRIARSARGLSVGPRNSGLLVAGVTAGAHARRR